MLENRRCGLGVVFLLAGLMSSVCFAAGGQITLRIRNTQSFPVYLDATGHEGVVWPYPNTTSHHLCGSGCDCFALAPPQPRVRVLAPGAEWVAQWDGGYYELQSCQGDGPDCVCAAVKHAKSGIYQAHVDGAAEVRAEGPPTAPQADYQDAVSPDTGKGRCHAEAQFELNGKNQELIAPIRCDTRAATPALGSRRFSLSAPGPSVPESGSAAALDD